MAERDHTPPTLGERLAALLALAALVAAVLIVLIGVATSWRGVLIALAGVLATVVGGWYAVSRRGFLRIAAVVLSAAGIGLLIAGIVVTDLNWLRVVITLALAAVSAGAARHALRRSATALRRRARSRTSARPAGHPVLIMNPKSGGGKAARFHLVEECRRRGIEPIVLERGDDLLQLAEDAIVRGADVIGMAGGDGSQALVASVAAAHDVPHVVIPAGTRNHFALDLGLDRDDVVGALDAFTDGYERRIDLATVNDRIFVNNASLGLYARIVQSPEYRDAKLQTAAAMLPGMLGPDAQPLDLRFRGPNGADRSSAQLILVSNDPYRLHNLAGRGTRERIDLGVLGVLAATINGAGEAGAFVALEAAGQVRRFPGWQEWTAPRFRVDSAGPVEIGVDGEALTLDPPLLFETRPQALRVRLPRHALGLSPAARAVDLLSGSTVVELVGVAVGRSEPVTPMG